MRWFFTIITILFCVVIQTTLIPFLSIKLGIANIILVIFIILLFRRDFKLALIWASIGGILLDFLTSLPVGIYFLGFMIIYGILYFFFQQVELEEFLALLFIIFAASILFDLWQFLYFHLVGYGLSFKEFLNIIVFDSVLNIIFTVLIYPILSYIKRYLAGKKPAISLSNKNLE